MMIMMIMMMSSLHSHIDRQLKEDNFNRRGNPDLRECCHYGIKHDAESR